MLRVVGMTKPLLTFLLSCVVASTSVFAEIFPTRSGNVDIIYTDDTYVDLATKVWMIDNAKKSIDVSAFIFFADQFGLTFISALRRALDRGVEVRVMFESTLSRTLGKDYLLRTTDLLVDPTLKKQAKILQMGGWEKGKSPVALNDYLHEKFVLVDVMTEDEIIYFGGRDPADFARATVDSGYFIRPIDRRKVYVGDDIRMYYNSLWVLLSQHFTQPTTSASSAEKARELLKKLVPIEKSYTDATRAQLKSVLDILSKKPGDDSELAEFQFRPQRAQVVTNEVIRKLTVGLKGKTFNVRPEMYKEDDIIKSIRHMVSKSNSVDVVSYSSHFVAPLHEAFQELISRGGKLTVYTNGAEAMSAIDSLGISEVSYDYTVRALRSMKEEAQKRLQKAPGLQIKGLDRVQSLNATNGLRGYLHRKLMLFNDQYLMTGSYNFTESSSSKNDEFLITFDDKRMNAHHRKLLNIENKTFYKPLNLKEGGILSETKKSIKRLFMGNIVKSQY